MGSKIVNLFGVLFKVFSCLLLIFAVNNMYLIWSTRRYSNKRMDALNRLPKGIGSAAHLQREKGVSRLIVSVLDLDFDHLENSTHKFRCINVYRLTDNNNAMNLDKEVIYQINEVLDPWDFKEAANISIVGSPIVSLAADYFNDFSDSVIFTGYGDGFHVQNAKPEPRRIATRESSR